MKKRVWILLAAVLIALSGCSGPEKSEAPRAEEEVTESAVAEEKREARESAPEEKEAPEKEEKTELPVPVKTEEEPEESFGGTETGLEAAEKPKAGEKKASDPPKAAEGKKSTKEEKTEEKKAEEGKKLPEEKEAPESEGPEEKQAPEAPAEKEEPVSEEPASGPEKEPEEKEIPQEPEKEEEEAKETDFDIEKWVGYAKSLAEKKGLRLDPAARDSWDSPISANPKCRYLERDLNTRLERYARDGEISSVWIWYESLGDRRFLLYIGYA